jgi:DNA-binding PucR family transcriptional regulator
LVAADDELGQALVDRRLMPLVALGEFGAALRDSVAVYLADMRVDQAARRLHLHPNTLRYRLRKFEELTGTDLRRGDDVVEVWWALQHLRRAERSQADGSTDALSK